jgi:hypothetical protein
MSRESPEVARAAIEDFIAGKTALDADGTLTRMAGEENWHPDIELDVTEAVVPEMRGVFRGKEAGRWLASSARRRPKSAISSKAVAGGDRLG